MTPGKSTRPLNLPTKAPSCFESQKVWNLYRQGATYSAGNGHTYCTDCTPAHKQEMQIHDRCRFPGTVFVRIGGVTVGRRRVK